MKSKKDVAEMIFDIAYMVVLWFLVGKMFTNLGSLAPGQATLGKVLAWTFAVLALGDTGHVGFRALAYLRGGLQANASLVGAGKFATSLTLTAFYSLLLVAWSVRFNQSFNLMAYLFLASALVRTVILLFPGNQWSSAVTPFKWALYRNIPFWILGLGVDLLILSSAIATHDLTFLWVGIMILVSFAFYTPVVLFAHKRPTLGALMVPKTVAYLAAAFVAYFGVFQ